MVLGKILYKKTGSMCIIIQLFYGFVNNESNREINIFINSIALINIIISSRIIIIFITIFVIQTVLFSTSFHGCYQEQHSNISFSLESGQYFPLVK